MYLYHPKFSIDKPLFYYTHIVTLVSRVDRVYDTRSVTLVFDKDKSYTLGASDIMFCLTSFHLDRPMIFCKKGEEILMYTKQELLEAVQRSVDSAGVLAIAMLPCELLRYYETELKLFTKEPIEHLEIMYANNKETITITYPPPDSWRHRVVLVTHPDGSMKEYPHIYEFNSRVYTMKSLGKKIRFKVCMKKQLARVMG